MSKGALFVFKNNAELVNSILVEEIGELLNSKKFLNEFIIICEVFEIKKPCRILSVVGGRRKFIITTRHLNSFIYSSLDHTNLGVYTNIPRIMKKLSELEGMEEVNYEDRTCPF